LEVRSILKTLFPDFKSFKIFAFTEDSSLEELFEKPFIFKLLKRAPSHLVLLLIPFFEKSPLFFLKAYHPRPFKRNRLKALYKALINLENLKIPHLKPLYLFYVSPLYALFKRKPFYGGAVYPFLKKGFLKEKDFFGEEGIRLLEELVCFIFSLHEKGVLLRDTKFYNFYKDELGFKVFDLDGIKILKKKPSKEARLKDLSALTMTLMWSGMANADKIIFKTYEKLYPEISEKDFSFFFGEIEKRRKKRLKKLRNKAKTT